MTSGRHVKPEWTRLQRCALGGSLGCQVLRRAAHRSLYRHQTAAVEGTWDSKVFGDRSSQAAGVYAPAHRRMGKLISYMLLQWKESGNSKLFATGAQAQQAAQPHRRTRGAAAAPPSGSRATTATSWSRPSCATRPCPPAWPCWPDPAARAPPASRRTLSCPLPPAPAGIGGLLRQCFTHLHNH